MLDALPRWARWTAALVMGLGVLSVVAIPFVDATRLVPTTGSGPASYEYDLELTTARVGTAGRVRVTVTDGVVSDVRALACLSDIDCPGLAAPFIPFGALAAETSGRHWTVVGEPPLIVASFDDPAVPGDERVVRVLAYREG